MCFHFCTYLKLLSGVHLKKDKKLENNKNISTIENIESCQLEPSRLIFKKAKNFNRFLHSG